MPGKLEGKPRDARNDVVVFARAEFLKFFGGLKLAILLFRWRLRGTQFIPDLKRVAVLAIDPPVAYRRFV